ncbi:hypothetical protein GCM10022403_080860 [Streptomyces coacervatus]|uniref:Uncharacterized protein n=1 Tax=Streptomyces coacervatus TaxID=647381 RepID=A0ABP7J7T4_9ACTN|nr:hypothetical protein [Streptomyces coacervatus]MDF2273483.1 hypothetical protein [Streptomyces coacervatus]
MSGEASEAASGDVHGRVVGGHAEEFVPLTDLECLVAVLVEGVHDGLAGRGRLERIGLTSVSGRREFGDDLLGSGQLCASPAKASSPNPDPLQETGL